MLGQVFNLRGVNVNAEMIKSGLAVHYPFQKGCSSFMSYESEAKRNRFNVWSVEHFCLPWNFRYNKC
jgi:micrococcal nuclease